MSQLSDTNWLPSNVNDDYWIVPHIINDGTVIINESSLVHTYSEQDKKCLTYDKFLDKYNIDNFYQLESQIDILEKDIINLDKDTLKYLNIEYEDIRFNIEQELIDIDISYLVYLTKITKKTQKKLLELHCNNIKYINNPDITILLDFIRDNLGKFELQFYLSNIMKYIIYMPIDLQKIILNIDITNAKFFDIHEAVFREIIINKPRLISFMKNLTLDLCVEAVYINKQCYHYIPEKYLTQELKLSYKMS